MEKFYVSTQELSVGYRGVPLVSDIRIELEKGEILSLIGPNGAGKTTILKHFIRQMEPVGGAVYLDGRRLEDYSGEALARKLSVVLTERVRTELMTCWDVVATGRYPYTGKFGVLSPEDRQVVRAAMEQVHILELADRDFTRISDGQRQRCLLARAICQEPELIVLDEPTAYLDIRHKIELLDILRDMAKERRITVIMSLHEIDLAMKISDRLLCVTGDARTYFGSPEEVLAACPIHRLYELERGSYDPLFGSVELAGPEGEPEVFVVAGAGCGIPCYRELQKHRIPFATGILFENDVDHRVAAALSNHVISVPAFQRMGDTQYQAACRQIGKCRAVIDAGTPAGELNELNRALLSWARERGVPVWKP